MERDEERGQMFDRADDTREDEAYEDDLQKQLYDMVEQALDEAMAKGVCVENLRILARETGMTKWALERSL